MAAKARHKDRILDAAASLFRERGYFGTGLADILEQSGAPKGSLYHYFPGGKVEIAVAAVRQSGDLVGAALSTLAGSVSGPAELSRRYAAALAAELARTHWSGGCPIATVLLDVTPAEPEIALAGHEALVQWAKVFEQSANRAGFAEARARKLGAFAVAAFEGALIQARVAKAPGPLIDVGDELSLLFELR